ncbi:hypothetical protein [Vulcanisaeta distributa]|uniref:hypothetical protein n=1 Tax=Vulcanisaeta distributa TaxID=164451 RepID=UPI001FB4648B|nr:hypothetical protein [Vulcanisaeta distributa]
MAISVRPEPIIGPAILDRLIDCVGDGNADSIMPIVVVNMPIAITSKRLSRTLNALLDRIKVDNVKVCLGNGKVRCVEY